MSDGMTDAFRNGEEYRARLAREAEARIAGGKQPWTRADRLLFDATENEFYQRAGYTSHWRAAQELAVATAAEQLRQTTGMVERQLQRTRDVEFNLTTAEDTVAHERGQRLAAQEELARVGALLHRMTGAAINWSGECQRATIDCRPLCPYCVAVKVEEELQGGWEERAAPREA
jgi:hypothetical protein